MSQNWAQDIADMHTKFGVNSVVREFDAEKLHKMLQFRINFLNEEYSELVGAAGDPVYKKPDSRGDDIVDACIDLIVVALGTLNIFDVDAQLAWDRVHEKNMQKEVGIKAERPNPLGLPDLIKPAGWESPSHADNLGLLETMF